MSCPTVDDWLDHQGPCTPWHWWEPRGQGQEASLGKSVQPKALRILEYSDYTICTPHLALPLILSSFSRWPIPCMPFCTVLKSRQMSLPVACRICSFRHMWPSRMGPVSLASQLLLHFWVLTACMCVFWDEFLAMLQVPDTLPRWVVLLLLLIICCSCGAFMCPNVCRWAHLYEGNRGWCLWLLFSTLFFETRSFTETGIYQWLAWLASELGSPVPGPPQTTR